MKHKMQEERKGKDEGERRSRDVSSAGGKKMDKPSCFPSNSFETLHALCVTLQEKGADCSVGVCSYVFGWGRAYFTARKMSTKMLT